MHCFLRNSMQRALLRTPLAAPSSSSGPTAAIHTTPVLRGAVWKKYQWTPWPWPIGMKNRRAHWIEGRPGYQRMRRPYRPRPGSEEGQISGPYFKKFSAIVQEEALKLLHLFTRQCEVYAAQRIRRAHQIALLYGKLYNRQTAGTLLRNFAWNSTRNRAPGSLMAFVGATVFALEKPQQKWTVEITDGDIERCFDDLSLWSIDTKNRREELSSEWESVTNTANCDVWVKTSAASSGLPEYRALGSFSDIPANVFFQTQLDLVYRRQWDKLVVKLDVIDKDPETGTEVLHWVSQFPFPYNPREYVYQRRYKVDESRRAMVVISKGCEHPKVSSNSSYVRVRNYYSALLIRPHRTFEEDGFDYVLVYIDDPQTFLPRMAVQYAAKSTLPDFMAKLHDAAKAMLKRLGRPPPSSPSSSSTLATGSQTSVGDKENVRVSMVDGGDVFNRPATRLKMPSAP